MKRTAKAVERELSVALRARRRLNRDLLAATRALARGGIMARLQEFDRQPSAVKVRDACRKGLRILGESISALEAELAALTAPQGNEDGF